MIGLLALHGVRPAAPPARSFFLLGDALLVRYRDGQIRELDRCDRCHGEGVLPHFAHVEGGACFRCGGDGVAPCRVETPASSRLAAWFADDDEPADPWAFELEGGELDRELARLSGRRASTAKATRTCDRCPATKDVGLAGLLPGPLWRLCPKCRQAFGHWIVGTLKRDARKARKRG